jgi:small subunit ribosomal protein S8
MDPIANMITTLKNAGDAGRSSVEVSYSRIKEDILKVLLREGFIKSVEKRTKGVKSFLDITLHLENRVPKIQGVKRISKTSKRIYRKSGELKSVRSGYGALILTTPQGVMTGRDARKAKVGGEVLFSIW